MASPSRNTVWAACFVEELARSGVTDVCLAPGSRSTPLVLAAAGLADLRLRVHLDERSAAFFALGRAKATGRATAVFTTSGTAVANLMPAVVEADLSETPLVLVTADRPHHLRDADANQAIDQVRVFGRRVRASYDLALPRVDDRSLRHLRAVVCRAVAEARGLPGGPVHVNVPFEKPLEPIDDPAVTEDDGLRLALTGRGDRAFVSIPDRRPTVDASELGRLREDVLRARRPLIVAGPAAEPRTAGPAACRLAVAFGAPLLADPLSGARFGDAGGAVTCAAYDLALRVPAAREALRPDFVLRVGRSPTSAALLGALGAWRDVPQSVIDPGASYKDHLAIADRYLRADVAEVARVLAAEEPGRADASWLAEWSDVDRQVESVVAEALDSDWSEPSVAREVVRACAEGSTLFAGSSMPVRDIDAYGGGRSATLRVVGNRGASGIDGSVSSALGASTGSKGRTLALIGDVTLLHDVGGLLAAREADAAVTFVVVHNDGGGIFQRLPVRTFEPEFTRLFVTPHGLEFDRLAGTYGLGYHRPSGRDAFLEALEAAAAGGTSLITVPCDRIVGHEVREAIDRDVAAALGERAG